jgi:hypothetical protein
MIFQSLHNIFSLIGLSDIIVNTAFLLINQSVISDDVKAETATARLFVNAGLVVVAVVDV